MNRQRKIKDKIAWCKGQKKGIELVEPNDNIAEAYLTEAENTLILVKGEQNKWETIMAYYACYNALYALLMKAGIKCEIHDCTLEIMKLLSAFDENDFIFVSSLKSKRIQAQYYLKQVFLDDLLPVKRFVQKCRNALDTLDIEALRKKIEK